MAITVCHNPVLLSARRGRSTTVLVLEDNEGSRVQLVFSSLSGVTALKESVLSATDILMGGGRGTDWFSGRPSRRARAGSPFNGRDQRDLLGLLNRLGLLDRPYSR